MDGGPKHYLKKKKNWNWGILYFFGGIAGQNNNNHNNLWANNLHSEMASYPNPRVWMQHPDINFFYTSFIEI